MSVNQFASFGVSVDRGECFLWTSDWDSASRDGLRALGFDWIGMTCTSGGVTKEIMSHASRIFGLLQPPEVVTSLEGRDNRQVCTPAYMPSPGPPSQDGGEGIRRQDESL